MKRTYVILTAALAMMLAPSCGQAEQEGLPAAGTKEIKLSAGLGNYTKATDTEFENGDEIGLNIIVDQVYLENAKFTISGGVPTPDRTYYWYDDNSLKSTVFAYYPYSAEFKYSNSDIVFTVNADQSTHRLYTQSDFMSARVEGATPTDESVYLPFVHMLSKVVIRIEDNLGEEITDVYFSDVYGSTNINPVSLKQSPTGSKGTIRAAKAYDEKGGVVWTLILAPQAEVLPELIVTTASQKQMTFTLQEPVTFIAGYQTSATIVLDAETHRTEFIPEISDWLPENDLDFDKEGDDEPEPDPEPEPAPAYYIKVAEDMTNWSGDYLITYTDGNSVTVFNSWEGKDKGKSDIDLGQKLTSEGIHSDDGDPYKATVNKLGEGYSVYITGIGYIGLESSSNSISKTDEEPTEASDDYLWTFSYKNGGSVWMTNAGHGNYRLQWNSSASIFRCYTGSQKEITLYRRSISGTGSTPKPDPTPDPDPDPVPDPDPTPDPDPVPDPTPGTSGKYSWYELPVMNLRQSGNYLTDASDPDLYYAYHHCGGGEKGPGGKTARNYTVCYSAEHHCPVWVAAPRHDMYEGSANRTNAYGKDPSIPSDIQYNSKDTGGGCNKGHMLGSAERTSSTATNRQVFYYTNIAPQYSSTFNTGGGGWNTLEDWVDGKVCRDTLYVVIGTYFKDFTDRRGYSEAPKTISFGGRSDVTRPSMFYYILMRTKKGNTGKALKDCSADEIMCAAFVRSHATPKGTAVGEKDMMSVSDLEKITGFTYFPNVPNAPKNVYKASDWGL